MCGDVKKEWDKNTHDLDYFVDATGQKPKDKGPIDESFGLDGSGGTAGTNVLVDESLGSDGSDQDAVDYLALIAERMKEIEAAKTEKEAAIDADLDSAKSSYLAGADQAYSDTLGQLDDSYQKALNGIYLAFKERGVAPQKLVNREVGFLDSSKSGEKTSFDKAFELEKSQGLSGLSTQKDKMFGDIGDYYTEAQAEDVVSGTATGERLASDRLITLDEILKSIRDYTPSYSPSGFEDQSFLTGFDQQPGRETRDYGAAGATVNRAQLINPTNTINSRSYRTPVGSGSSRVIE
jgi:hypothetical protein